MSQDTLELIRLAITGCVIEKTGTLWQVRLDPADRKCIGFRFEFECDDERYADVNTLTFSLGDFQREGAVKKIVDIVDCVIEHSPVRARFLRE